MTPNFQTLTAHPSMATHRLVDGVWMDYEQYQTEQWEVVRTYTRDDGSTGAYWQATLDGLRRYGQLRRSREEAKRAERRYRREADDEWSEHIAKQIEGNGRE